ncbi:MAG TPA: alanine racemase [Coxiellaceae bacterium]|nr:MAG: alanine racemase [Gammaproteobacteria bacterium RIFCSPHIGHO2_12_FULL_36_30]HLB56526.1 alanine racemase [Coxiellaceae bacterium]
MNSTATSIIDLSAIKHNLHLIQEMMPKQKILAMIKSNAYGHGLIPVAKALGNADALGVATIAEALQLRNAGIDADIVVMRGFATRDELSIFFADDKLIACVHEHQQLFLLENNSFSENKKLRIWMKIDTGMHRLGFSCDEFQEIYNRLNKLSFIEKHFVVCSHLADADNVDPTFTRQQIMNFENATKNISNEKSLLNSAGIIAHARAHYDWIRPGLLLYGVTPFNSTNEYQSVTKNFMPAMTLESKLIAVKNVKRGEKIGYTCTYIADRDMKIGIVGMGYGDSYPRQAKNGTPVLIREQRCPIVGRVSMDMITVDVSALKEVSVDDTVTLWGRDLSVVEVAQCANTISHELLCHLTGRVNLMYI